MTLQLKPRDLPGDQPGDAAEADQAERLAGQVPVGPGPVAVPDPLADEPVLIGDLADHGEQETDGVLGDLVHRGLGRVGHDDAETGRCLDRDVVGARAGAQDHPAPAQARQDLGA